MLKFLHYRRISCISMSVKVSVNVMFPFTWEKGTAGYFKYQVAYHDKGGDHVPKHCLTCSSVIWAWPVVIWGRWGLPHANRHTTLWRGTWKYGTQTLQMWRSSFPFPLNPAGLEPLFDQQKHQGFDAIHIYSPVFTMFIGVFISLLVSCVKYSDFLEGWEDTEKTGVFNQP